MLQGNYFKRVKLFLVLSGTFIAKFMLNNEHAQDYSCLRGTLTLCSHGEKLPWQRGLLGIVQRVTRLSKFPRATKNSYANSNRRQMVDPGKVNFEITDLPWVYVNKLKDRYYIHLVIFIRVSTSISVNESYRLN